MDNGEEQFETEKGTILQLFLTFLQISAFTFGGGYVMVPLMQDVVVDKKKWLSSEEFIELLSLSQSIPGALAVNVSLFVGHKLFGLKGAVVALSASILPAFSIMLVIAFFFNVIRDSLLAEKFFQGVRPAVTALIAVAVYKMGKPVLINNKKNIVAVIFFVFLSIFLDLSPAYIIILALIFGLVVKLGKWDEK